MIKKYDYVIVGAGLTGSTIARCLINAGREVLVIDRRFHVGGNCYDKKHINGQIFHVYGPHSFRTNNADLWAWLNKYSDFYSFKLKIKIQLEDKCVVWPPTNSYIEDICGKNWISGFQGIPTNFEEASFNVV